MTIIQTIQQMGEILAREVPPGSRIYLFGSQARGTATEHSDVDLLVVEPEVARRFAETNRLSRLLRRMGVPVDLIVLSRETFEDWRNVPGTLAYEVASEGRLLNEVVQ